MVHPINPSLVSIQGYMESSNLVQTVRNVLTGRISTNWQQGIYRGMAILHIAALAYSILSGYWIFSLIYLVSIFGDGLAQKFIEDLGSYREQNIDHLSANLSQELLLSTHKVDHERVIMQHEELLRVQAEKYKSQMKQLSRRINEMHKENKFYQEQNNTLGLLLGEFKSDIVSNRNEYKNLIKQGKAVNNHAAKEYAKRSEDLEARIGQLQIIHDDMQKKTSVSMDNLNELTEALKNANAGNIRLANEMMEKAVEAEKRVVAAASELQTLSKEIGALKKERIELRKERQKFHQIGVDLEKNVGFLGRIFNWGGGGR